MVVLCPYQEFARDDKCQAEKNVPYKLKNVTLLGKSQPAGA